MLVIRSSEKYGSVGSVGSVGCAGLARSRDRAQSLVVLHAFSSIPNTDESGCELLCNDAVSSIPNETSS